VPDLEPPKTVNPEERRDFVISKPRPDEEPVTSANFITSSSPI
jgi:hypothetical protein